VSTEGAPAEPHLELLDSREAEVGAIRVRRALPRRRHRTVGAWCFADHMGPAPVTEEHGLDIGPHPHIGLQTVTWLLAGEALHRDSLGSEQLLRPGQLNLMTAGHGVAHSEEATGRYRGDLHGIQLWVAQPDATRDGPPAFEHHAELPSVDLDGAQATVLVGDLAGTTSPARRDTDHVGAQLDVRAGRTTVPLRATYEHALVVLEGTVRAGASVAAPGHLGYLAPGGDALVLDADAPARVMLLGGVPFPTPILMWWNFVARDATEMAAARDAWESRSRRFGAVESSLPRIPAPLPSWPSGRPVR
jgi:redox-sensitive bicupin YhaK (pirin superfamily)